MFGPYRALDFCFRPSYEFGDLVYLNIDAEFKQEEQNCLLCRRNGSFELSYCISNLINSAVSRCIHELMKKCTVTGYVRSKHS